MKKETLRRWAKSPVAIWTVVALAVAVVLAAGGRRSHPGEKLKKLLHSETEIEQTLTIVEQVRATAEYGSVRFYDEFVVNYVKDNAVSKSGLNHLFKDNLVPKDRMVLICKGTVRAGFDLKKVGEDDVRVKGDTLWVRLPKPEYLDVVLNPSDFEYFERTGNWSHYQDSRVKAHAKEQLLADADKNHLLEKAQQVGTTRLEAMLKKMGFGTVVLTVEPAQKAAPKPAKPMKTSELPAVRKNEVPSLVAK